MNPSLRISTEEKLKMKQENGSLKNQRILLNNHLQLYSNGDLRSSKSSDVDDIKSVIKLNALNGHAESPKIKI